MQNPAQRTNLLAIVVLFMSLYWQPGCHASMPDLQAESISPLFSQPNNLLQFNHGKHLIGFAPDSIYAAAGDHVLRIGFPGASMVLPEPIYAGCTAQTTSLQHVIYRDIWNGIDLMYEPADNGIVESTWTIGPGVNPGQIQLRYNSPVTIEENGALRIVFKSGWIQESPPIAWQDIDGTRYTVPVAFRKIDTSEIGFTIGNYDPNFPLTIDPVMQWNTFMGAYLWDVGGAVAVDGAGNVYVAGRSSQTWGTPINPHSGDNNIDAFVAKFDGSGVLQWNTFIGSATTTELINTISADGSGNILIGGYGTGNWGDPVQPYAGGDYDAFFAKLNPDGTRAWHTFIGSADTDFGYAIIARGTGSYIIVGGSNQTWGEPLTPHSGGQEVFIAMLDASGALQWSTFTGGSGDDTAVSLALDVFGNIFLGGYSSGSWGAPINGYSGGKDAFAAKLTAGGVLQWNTFMGSSGDDYGNGIVVDLDGNVALGGYSNATWGTPLNVFNGGLDVFVARLDTNGTRLWNTFLGSAADESGGRLAVDGDGNITVAGTGYASWGTPLHPYAGGPDAFAAQLDSSGILQWNLFMGSATNNYDYGYNVGVDCAGNVFVVGTSDGGSWGTPIAPWIYGTSNAFLVRIGEPGHAVCTLTQGGQGSFTPPWNLVETDNTAEFTINAESGYTIASVTGCGGTWTGSNPYTTAPITTNCQVAVDFASVQPYAVAPVAGPPLSLIAGGSGHSLAVKNDGTVDGWGHVTNYPDPPPDLDNVAVVAAGNKFSLALKQNSTVIGWGLGYQWLDDPLIPEGLNDVIAISAGGDHALALRKDGTVVAWGDNSLGQTMVPEGLTEAIAVAGATSGHHSLALKEDGTVIAWGWNNKGQCNVPADLTDVIAIAGGYSHSIALKKDGTVVAWGDNYFGQLVIPSGLTDVVAIASGAASCYALKQDGSLTAWGYNVNGETDVPPGLTGVVAIAAGASHALALKGDGTVVVWGDNYLGQTDVPAGLNLLPFRGVHGTISPDMPQAVQVGDTFQFTVSKEAGYAPLVGGSCGGSLVENVYTTDPIYADCRVIASFNRMGDIDGNARLELTDSIIALQNVTGHQSSSTPGPAADISGDEKIGLAEIIYILNEIAGTP